MKNLIFISTLLTAGTLAAFAAAPTGTYEDGNGKTQDFEFVTYGSSCCLDLNSGTYKNVIINSNGSNDDIGVSIGSSVTFDIFTFTGTKFDYFCGAVGSVLGGKIEFSNVWCSDIYSNLSSGTHFSINSNSRICFYSNVWDIAEADLSKPLVEGTGEVRMSSNATFTLNFLSEKLLKEQKICLVSTGTQVETGYSGFKNIAITVDGKAVEDWFATQSKDGRTISISRTVPEPSMFGLLAGTLALVLAGTRRRRRK